MPTNAFEVASRQDLSGHTALVTGGSSGLGAVTAVALATAGADVLITARDMQAGEETLAELRRAGPGRHGLLRLDLADALDVHQFADKLQKNVEAIEILIANAGVAVTPDDRLANGFDVRFACNYLGHFLLINQVLGLLSVNGARIVMLGSAGHKGRPINLEDPAWLKRDIDQRTAYGESKSACSLLAVEATRRWHDRGIFANCVLPGSVLTGLMRHYSEERMAELLKIAGDSESESILGTVEQQASTSVWAATAPELDRVGGLVLEDCAPCKIAGPDFHPWRGYELHSTDSELARQLWQNTLDFIARHNIPFGAA